MTTLKEKIAALAESLKGDWFQSDWAGFEGKLVEVLYNMADEFPAPQILAALTVNSSATSFTDAEGLTEEEVCTALGITSEQLAALFAGSFLRFAYGTNGASILSVAFVSSNLVMLGAAETAEVGIAKINDTYSIKATYV